MASPTAGGGNAELAKLLNTGAAQLAFLDGLDAPAKQRLAADVAAAHAAHAAHIKGRMQEALEHLPWLLRAPVRKLFGV